MTIESIMTTLGQFGTGVIDIWESVATFVTSHPIALLPLFAWLFVMATGGILRLFKA